ncbi:hypothetical protein RMB13_17085 [Acinetobacter sp. V102_4]|uniref:hypothetical protein n=1 Tax=Acinetobacter sp. V102_4 TaxID=3072984 RepID=UPI00287EC82A|nr:hypothetical protein [Acinetobacter sp. V102_4]MDS7931155.1 hypothetical protein [Acinetobacter sp. V102_4]
MPYISTGHFLWLLKKAALSTTTPERDEKGHFVFSQDDAQNHSFIKKLLKQLPWR